MFIYMKNTPDKIIITQEVNASFCPLGLYSTCDFFLKIIFKYLDLKCLNKLFMAHTC